MRIYEDIFDDIEIDHNSETEVEDDYGNSGMFQFDEHIGYTCYAWKMHADDYIREVRKTFHYIMNSPVFSGLSLCEISMWGHCPAEYIKPLLDGFDNIFINRQTERTLQPTDKNTKSTVVDVHVAIRFTADLSFRSPQEFYTMMKAVAFHTRYADIVATLKVTPQSEPSNSSKCYWVHNEFRLMTREHKPGEYQTGDYFMIKQYSGNFPYWVLEDMYRLFMDETLLRRTVRFLRNKEKEERDRFTWLFNIKEHLDNGDEKYK